MKKKFLLIGVLFVLFSCHEKTKDSTTTTISQTVNYNNYKSNLSFLIEDNTSDIFLNTDYLIELEGNPSTGYWWYYTIGDNTIIKNIDSKTFDFHSGEFIVGAPIIGIWKFKCLKIGETKITFKYYRSWEGEDSASETKIFNIKVKSF
ncbi:MAG: hypothetical protein A2086_16110 [Spirochaetes bacterium GWD1_27_9]|nr:MAG: hypothetical protein A2Z98_11735 [Spirochaetes bacterium GWB1_27_13]OHD22615.1 MAG: hypothetical protein A2Y34_07560 [Spirochaetes bacterium GWC1_27_15]OHD37319.1 MAG: hypothetical protein A2086_16110 [Spirochaetes bacterium GWD1_27_9]